jgi:hypothetical protein
MLEQANEMMEAIFEDEHFLPNIAKLMRKFFDELVKAGFTEEQATRIAANYKAQ